MQPSTRSVVATLLLGVLLLTAGCSGLQGDDDAATNLKLVNQDDVEHAVVVEVGTLADDPDPDYTAGRTVDAESDVDLEPFAPTGEYELTVTVDGESSVHTHTFDGGESETVTIGIDNDGAVTVGQ